MIEQENWHAKVVIEAPGAGLPEIVEPLAKAAIERHCIVSYVDPILTLGYRIEGADEHERLEDVLLAVAKVLNCFDLDDDALLEFSPYRMPSMGAIDRLRRK